MLKDDTGSVLTDPSEILDFEKKYFEEIYMENPSTLRPIEEMEDLLHVDTEIPQVTDSHRNIINLPFTPRELHSALKELNHNKSPGSDGITPEFYLAFWDLLHETFYDSIMFSLAQGSLSQEQRTGIITLIPKKCQDRLLLNNWRPITLLNTDFKIFSKAISNRLQFCIKDVVSSDQTGFIKARTIGSNITNIQTVIDHTKATSSTGLLLAVDYRKAFDTIRWELIHYALARFGFGDFLSSAIKILFQDIKTCIFNSGFGSGYFFPSRGIRQGCCCSPSLFVIAVEFLAILVRQNTDIKGITVAHREVKISQYADDASFFIPDYTSLDHLLHLINAFAVISGLYINCHKSYLLLLGHHLDPPNHHQGIKICDQVTILGIVFRYEMTEAQHYALNYEQKLNKIKAICSSWSNRTLSMKGRVLLITSLMASILQYPISFTTTPARVLVDFKQITTDFVWNNKKGKVAYNVLVQDIPDGGIKLPDLQTRIATSQVYWIKHLWQNQESLMAAVLKDAVQYHNIHYLLACKTELAPKLHQNYTFLRGVLTAWAKIHLKEPTTEADIKHELLWDNNFIRINKHPVSWTRWKDAGILHVNDLLHENEMRFLSHTELGDKFGVTVSFLELLQVRSAMPCLWKRKMVDLSPTEVSYKPLLYTVEGDSISVIGKSSKLIYYMLIKFRKPVVTSQTRWNDIFPVDPQERHDYWAGIYKAPYKAARETKLQAFQYRVVHRFLPCNQFLKNIRIRRDDTCSFCPEVDSIVHFLFTCPIVVTFWREVSSWFAREVDVQLQISPRAFLFGVPDSLPQAKIINFIILFAKFFIYRQKLFHQGSLDLTHFLRELRLRLQIEQYITNSENKRQIFDKWRRIYTALG